MPSHSSRQTCSVNVSTYYVLSTYCAWLLNYVAVCILAIKRQNSDDISKVNGGFCNSLFLLLVINLRMRIRSLRRHWQGPATYSVVAVSKSMLY